MYSVVVACIVVLAATVDANQFLGGGLVYAPRHSSVDYYSYPKYAFEYAVKDPHTGDNKAQWEKRDGDVVKGAYSLVEPDGSLRVVEYWADDISGFNAVVKKLGPNLHPVPAPVSIYKAPIPVLGHSPAIAPISVGPVANLRHLADAPLISGPYGGGPIRAANFGRTPIPVAPIAPIVPITPVIKSHSAPIVTIDNPIASIPSYHGLAETDHLPTGLPGPIYQAGAIYSVPVLKPGSPTRHYEGHSNFASHSLPLELSGYEVGNNYAKAQLLEDHQYRVPLSGAGLLHDIGHGLLSNPWHESQGSSQGSLHYLDKQ